MFGKKKLVPKPRIRKLYVIEDKVAEQFGPVFEALNDGVALRQFRIALEKSSFVSDFSLICIGYVNEQMSISTKDCPYVVEFDRDEFEADQLPDISEVG